MALKPILRDHRGELVDTARLTEEEGGATITGVRQPMPEHPSWGLSPDGLAAILRDSEGTDPSRYYALLSDVQEREWHYRGVLFQRRAALAQLPITVDPFSDKAEHVDHADFIRRIVMMPDFTHVRFELGDALDKGMAFGETIWDTSARQWMPTAIKRREQAWFRYDRVDLETPLLLDASGQPQPLKPYGWIVHRARLNSGIPIRDGLGRAAVWAWMFKNFSIKSWQIFLDRYGLPMRLGKFPASASRSERSQLLSALRNLGRDAAAIVPEGMSIEFTKADGGAGGGAAFKDNATYFDEQLSKLVLGQTGTTDASKGGYAVGRVHEGVRDAIALYDGCILSMTLNRDLVRPAIELNHGPQEGYPTIKIGLGDQRNIELIMENLGEMIDRGLPVEASQIYPMFGLTEPAKGKTVVLLKPMARPEPGEQPGGPPPSSEEDRADPSDDGGVLPKKKRTATLSAELGERRGDLARDSFDAATDAIIAGLGWVPEIDGLGEALAACTTPEEMEAVLAEHLDKLGTGKVAEILARARFAARLAGETSEPNG